MNINHAYPVTVLLDRDYVKRVNDSPDSAIHSTFSHFAAFFVVAVTKRFNVNRFNLYVFLFVYAYLWIFGKQYQELKKIHG